MPINYEVFAECYLWNMQLKARGLPLAFSTSSWKLPPDNWDALYNALEQAHAEVSLFGI